MDGIGYWILPAFANSARMWTVESVIQRIEAVTGVPITTKGRYRSLCEGRQLAAYIMHVKFGMTLYAVGERLGVDHATVAHSVKCIRTLLSLDKKFVTRWQDIIEFARLGDDTNVTEPNPIQDESDLPTKCEECAAYIIKQHFCELRLIRCYDSKPLATECRKYFLKKRV